ncbi:MAG TPA: ribosome maturation factor RimM [Wenzhouxiangella sp.]|nr:ribosome maturation factor RimM [Wenzhouxiangella sp.]
MKPSEEESVIVGRFNGDWGVRGWVKVFSYTRPPEAIFDYMPWLIDGHGDAIEPVEWKKSGPRLVARLEGVDTPEKAAALGRTLIRVARTSLPDPEPGEYYWHDLVGLEVVNRQNHSFGQISKMHETGAHDVMEVEGADGTVLIPFVTERFVVSIDLEARLVTVDWPSEWAEPD